MSLILDALNKAERERDLSEGIPDLTTLHHPPRATSNRDLWLIGLIGAVVALLIVVVVMLFVWRHDRAPIKTAGDSPPSLVGSAVDAETTASMPSHSMTVDAAVSQPNVEARTRVESVPDDSLKRDSRPTKSSLLPNEIEANPEVKALYQVQYGDVDLTEPKIAAGQPNSESAAKPVDSGAAPWQSLIDDVSLDAPAAERIAAVGRGVVKQGRSAQQIHDSYDAISDRAVRSGSSANLSGDGSSEDGSGGNDAQASVDAELARALWEQTRIQPVPANIIASAEATKKLAQQPIKQPEVDLSAGKNVEETLAGYSSIPFLHELPEATQNRIPSILYALHTFDKKSVVLNQKTVVAGATVANDLVVDRVLADGILLKFKGQTFKLAALSSWVNN